MELGLKVCSPNTIKISHVLPCCLGIGIHFRTRVCVPAAVYKTQIQAFERFLLRWGIVKLRCSMYQVSRFRLHVPLSFDVFQAIR